MESKFKKVLHLLDGVVCSSHIHRVNDSTAVINFYGSFPRWMTLNFLNEHFTVISIIRISSSHYCLTFTY